MSAWDSSDWVALNLLPGLGPVAARRALQRFPDPGEIAYRVPPAELAAIPGIRGGVAEAIAAARPGLERRVEAEMRGADRLGLRRITPVHPEYPAAFEALHDAPVLLYLRGELRQGIVRVAVVGSRRATAYGRRVSAGLAAGLASRRIEVVSGGARGIDTFAHVGALEGGGTTVCVLGSGFLRPYPAENAGLYDRIAERGGVLSEFPLEAEPRPEHFPRRNRLISGLSAAVVVVEAAERSGSLSTAAHALEQGREVMAVPGPVSSEQSAGCHRLIQQGAKLVHRVEDLIEELSPMYAAAVGPSAGPGEGDPGPRLEGLLPDENVVLALLLDDPEPVHLDLLADRAPFGFARLQAALFSLESRAAVEQLAGGYYLARPPKKGAGASSQKVEPGDEWESTRE